MQENSNNELDDLRRISRMDSEAAAREAAASGGAAGASEYGDYEETHIEPELRKDIEAILNVMVRPKLAEDGGDLDVAYMDDDGILWVQMIGGCHGCPSANDTVKGLVERELMKRLPQIKGVDIDDGYDYDFIQNALDTMLSNRTKH